MSSKDLQTVIKTQKAFIKELLDRLVDKDINNQISMISEGIFVKIQDKTYALKTIKDLLNDKYFKGLSLEQIIELAKKSIRLTDENLLMKIIDK